MTIHDSHPFADPPGVRDAARRFRGRLPAPVTLWCSGAGRHRAGLTVSSVLIAPGEPAHLVGLIDPDADLTAVLVEEGTFTVSVLSGTQRRLVEVFAGLGPAPGGAFADAAAWVDTAWGPRPAASDTWVGARLTGTRAIGWSLEVTATIEHVSVGDAAALLHLRGRLLAP